MTRAYLGPVTHLSFVGNVDKVLSLDRSSDFKFHLFLLFLDFDECQEGRDQIEGKAFCEQDCVNTLGSYVCQCREGYELHPDGKTCIGKDIKSSVKVYLKH